jgi:hypothetical protein
LGHEGLSVGNNWEFKGGDGVQAA